MPGLAYTTIPYGVPRHSDGKILTAKSMRNPEGQVPACWGHWETDDRSCSQLATYIAERNGLTIIHRLDEQFDLDAAILDMLRAGRSLYYSPGPGAFPAAMRAIVNTKAMLTRAIDTMDKFLETLTGEPPEPGSGEDDSRELIGQNIGHLAYVERPNKPQPAIKLISW